MPLTSNKLLDRFLLDGAGGFNINSAAEVDYVVDTGETVAAGDLVDLGSGKAQVAGKRLILTRTPQWESLIHGGCSARLADDKWVCGYIDGTTAYAVVATRGSNGTVTFGTPVSCGTGSYVGYSMAIVDTNKFVFAFSAGTGNALAICGTVVDTTITVGTAVTLGTASDYHAIAVCKLTTDKFLAVWGDGSNVLHHRAGSIATRTITLGTDSTLASGYNTGVPALFNHRTDAALVVFSKDSSSYAQLMSSVVTVVGTTISRTTAAQVSGTTRYALRASDAYGSRLVVIAANTSSPYTSTAFEFSVDGSDVVTIEATGDLGVEGTAGVKACCLADSATLLWAETYTVNESTTMRLRVAKSSGGTYTTQTDAPALFYVGQQDVHGLYFGSDVGTYRRTVVFMRGTAGYTPAFLAGMTTVYPDGAPWVAVGCSPVVNGIAKTGGAATSTITVLRFPQYLAGGLSA